MGQQQLILLVLATIIVGLAIVVGIRAFSENAIKSNSDAMMQDAVRIANDMQAWKQKPAPFGGQASTAATAAQVADNGDYTGVTFPLLGYAPDSGAATYTNLNGVYTLTAAAPGVIVGVNSRYDNQVRVTVANITDTGVNGVAECLGGAVAGGGATCGDL